ncbi:MAG: glutathione S-transferase family protein [Acuticoccus sp.]
MTPTIAALSQVPPFAKGLVKDIRVRWALEELGLPYDEFLVDSTSKDGADYRAWQPFGQVPAYRDGEVTLFESGAIVLYIAQRDTSGVLAPREANGNARVATWILAALNSMEPFVESIVVARLVFGEEPWGKDYEARATEMLKVRLAALAKWLGDKPYLEDRFTAGDLMMASVLRNVDDGLLEACPALAAYRARCVARPAFARALEGQLATFARAEAA